MLNDSLTAFRTYLVTERRFSLNSVSAYMADVEQFAMFLESNDLDIKEYSRNDVLAFLSTLNARLLAPSSKSRKVVSLRLFGSFLFDRYAIANNMEHIASPKPEQLLPRYLTEQEITQLLDFIKDEATTERGMRNYLMVVLLYSAGLRISELLSLTPTSFRFDTGFIEVVGKRGTHRSIPVPQAVMEHVRKYIVAHKGEELLFGSSRTEKSLSRQQCWNIVKDLVARAGVNSDVSPHSLRHSLATHFLGRGVDLRSLQVFLGHESIETVEVYTHIDRTALREAYAKAHPRK